MTKFIDMLNLAIKRECLFKCWSYLIILDWSVNTQSAHHWVSLILMLSCSSASWRPCFLNNARAPFVHFPRPSLCALTLFTIIAHDQSLWNKHISFARRVESSFSLEPLSIAIQSVLVKFINSAMLNLAGENFLRRSTCFLIVYWWTSAIRNVW